MLLVSRVVTTIDFVILKIACDPQSPWAEHDVPAFRGVVIPFIGVIIDLTGVVIHFTRVVIDWTCD